MNSFSSPSGLWTATNSPELYRESGVNLGSCPQKQCTGKWSSLSIIPNIGKRLKFTTQLYSPFSFPLPGHTRSLHTNNLHGSIPVEWSNISLTELSLGLNDLSGTVPWEIVSNTDLAKLYERDLSTSVCTSSLKILPILPWHGIMSHCNNTKRSVLLEVVIDCCPAECSSPPDTKFRPLDRTKVKSRGMHRDY